mgnify:CR=1 FL=1|tara:strand:+ start:779 stop:1327 length:549 start_codon:yes stop_codon:yes gene_type:complete
MLSKEKLRKKFIFLRKKKHFFVKRDFFRPLLKIIKNKKKRNISLYYPSNYEVDTICLFELIKRERNISTSLPKLLPDGKMKFVRWGLNDPLEVNKFGFLEPLNKRKSIIPEIVVVPLLAFDKYRNRLGYGKGYYDKFLSKHSRYKKKILTIGLAFSFQKYKKIPTRKYDVKLDLIITEKGVF